MYGSASTPTRDKKLDTFIDELNDVEAGNDNDGYMPEEKALLKILANYHPT